VITSSEEGFPGISARPPARDLTKPSAPTNAPRRLQHLVDLDERDLIDLAVKRELGLLEIR
jgi:hypothetical protein